MQLCICFCGFLFNVYQYVEQQTANNRLIFFRESVADKRRVQVVRREHEEPHAVQFLSRNLIS